MWEPVRLHLRRQNAYLTKWTQKGNKERKQIQEKYQSELNSLQIKHNTEINEITHKLKQYERSISAEKAKSENININSYKHNDMMYK